VRLTSSQKDGEKAPFSICECVYLRVAPSARAANSLLLLPPFPPAAERCALTCVESIICVSVDRPLSAMCQIVPTQTVWNQCSTKLGSVKAFGCQRRPSVAGCTGGRRRKTFANAGVVWRSELQGCCILSGAILALAGGCRIFDDFSHRLGMRDHYDMFCSPHDRRAQNSGCGDTA
jgi:hypothetical protein